MKNVVAENLDLNIDSDLFSPLSTEEKKADDVIRPSVGYWANAWRRLKQNKVALFSLVMIIVIIIFAIFGPILIEKLYGFTYKSTDKTASNLWPNAQHWFGTDNLGRDLFVRVMYGARYSLIPVVTYLGPLTAGVLTGSFVVEKIFAIPGLGNEFTLTITNRDYTALLGVLAFYCTFIVICNLVVDLLYVLVDPRIKLEA